MLVSLFGKDNDLEELLVFVGVAELLLLFLAILARPVAKETDALLVDKGEVSSVVVPETKGVTGSRGGSCGCSVPYGGVFALPATRRGVN